ncbi:MAG: Type II secretion system protein D precursor [Syntrophus sp. PtaB.Bin075]|nr:MAG: Type II secretion system protein D precursor [Syntrophus sp. PtaB.Bin075]
MTMTGFHRKVLTGVLIFLLPVFLIGCTSPPAWHQPVTLERSAGKDLQSEEAGGIGPSEEAKQPVVEEIRIPAFERKAPEKMLPPSQPIDPRRLTMANQPVTLNAERMPLSDFVIYALGETLKVAFVMDEKMMNNKKPITIRMPQAMPPDRALNVILGLLEKERIYLEERAGALYVLEVPPEPRSPVDVRIGVSSVDSPADILQVVPLLHIRPQDVEPLIKDLFRSDVEIKPYTRENVMILHGRASRMRPVLDFIATFDVPYLRDKNLLLIRLTYWQTEEFISQLTKILEGLGFAVARMPKEPGPYFLPVKQLNAVLAVCPDGQTARTIRGWKEKLDTPEAAGTEFKTYTFIPKYSRATDLLESIQKLYGSMPSSDSRMVQPAALTTPRGVAARPGSDRGDAFDAAGLRMSADDRKNMIIILSKPDVYRNLLNLLQALDVPARQVLIEATIVELTLTDELKYGVEWFIRNSWDGDSYTLGTLGKLGLEPLGLTYAFLSRTGQFEALISALAEKSKANILSTPRLMVLDNMEATIQVGKDVPTVTGQISTLDSVNTTDSTSVSQSIQYRSTGVMLKVKPTINTEGLMTLEITQEVSDIAETPGVGDSPIILTRRINTSIIATHGQTIVLGGLMQENQSLGESKVPLLGDIPILGNLFKATSKTKDKTELLVLVTPTILTDPNDAVKITDQLRKELKWIK